MRKSRMELEELGYNQSLENYRGEQKLGSLGIARVIAEHRERYIVKSGNDEFEAEVIGNLRFTAGSRAGFPAVGDWVSVSEYDKGKVLIHSIFPRKTIIEREAAGSQGEKQIIAANVDYAFLVQAVDGDFSINRLQRYLAICHESGVKPVILLSKTDLVSEPVLDDILLKVRERIKNVPVIGISNETRSGYDKLNGIIEKGKTYCMLGSSGTGKSTLLNHLSGREMMKTGEISFSTGKGKHVTSFRQLIVLDNGGILIDNPGMREVGIAGAGTGLETTFDTIAALTEKCRFRNCTHTKETGCAVLKAVENNEIHRSSLDNYLKMNREKIRFETTVSEKRKKDREFGKMAKRILKEIRPFK